MSSTLSFPCGLLWGYVGNSRTDWTHKYQFCWSQKVRNFWTATVASDEGANTIDLTSWKKKYFNVLDGSGYQRTTGPKLCNYVTHVTHGYKIGTGNANTQCEVMDNGRKKFTWKFMRAPREMPCRYNISGWHIFFYQSCTFKHSERPFNQLLCRSAQMSF